MLFQIISVLPESFGYLNQSIIGRGQQQGHFQVKIHDLRNWSLNQQGELMIRPMAVVRAW